MPLAQVKYRRGRRLAKIAATLLAVAAATSSMFGCTPAATKVAPEPIRLGTIPTLDSLPLWVAQEKGLFEKAGLDVKLYRFPSAQGRDRALTDGSVNGVQGDLIEPASARTGAVTPRVVTVMLGATPKQGPLGLVVAPGSQITTLSELADVPVATSLGTLQEYVLDTLMSEAGVPSSQVKTLEVNKIPVRYGLLIDGQVGAAMLPEPYLSLAVKQGARLIADDTKDDNLSQTVLLISEDYLQTPGGVATVEKLLDVWDQAVELIHEDPDAYRALLAQKTGLSEELVAGLEIDSFAKHQLPRRADVDRLLDWMSKKNLLTKPVEYSDLVWTPPD